MSYEGIDTGNGHIYVAQRQKGLGIYRRDVRGRFLRVGASRDLNNAWGVRVRGTTAFVSDGLAGLAILDVADPRKPVLLGRVNTGGQARGLALDGSTAYVAAGSAGLVVVDLSDLRPRASWPKFPRPAVPCASITRAIRSSWLRGTTRASTTSRRRPPRNSSARCA